MVKKARSRVGPRGEVADAEAQRVCGQGEGYLGGGTWNTSHQDMGARHQRQPGEGNKNVKDQDWGSDGEAGGG